MSSHLLQEKIKRSQMFGRVRSLCFESFHGRVPSISRTVDSGDDSTKARVIVQYPQTKGNLHEFLHLTCSLLGAVVAQYQGDNPGKSKELV